MKKALLLFVIFFSSNFYAQKSNSLLQIISGNSLLNQNEEVRKMQFLLNESMNNQVSGLNADTIVQNGFNSLKNVIESINIEFSNLVLKVYINKNSTDIFTLNPDQFKKRNWRFLIAQIQVNLGNSIQELLEKDKSVLGQIPDQLRNLTYYSLIAALYKDNFSEKEFLNTGKSYAALLSKYIAESTICNSIINYLSNKMNVNIDSEITKDNQLIDKAILDKINTALKQSVSDLKELFKNNLDTAEYNIKKLISNLSAVFYGADVGVSLAQGEGNLGGGFQLLFKASDSFNFGCFYSGQINTATQTDSSNKKTSNGTPLSYVGGQLRFASCNFEIDALLSIIAGPQQQRDKSWELGCGISYCFSKKIIIGGAYFFSKNAADNGSDPNIHTAGFSFKSTDPKSPTLIIGFNFPEHGTMQPMFQVSYPIQLQNTK